MRLRMLMRTGSGSRDSGTGAVAADGETPDEAIKKTTTGPNPAITSAIHEEHYCALVTVESRALQVVTVTM
jgi:hypothetical protein